MQVERRKHKRIKVKIPAEVHIILQEVTFKPFQMKGTIHGISPGGLKISLIEVKQDFFKKLMRPDRYMKIIFTSPLDKKEFHLIGRIVWLNYLSKERKLEAGLCFEELSQQNLILLTHIINLLESEEYPDYHSERSD